MLVKEKLIRKTAVGRIEQNEELTVDQMLLHRFWD